jgi:2-iminobutanoate/2-iminopropanoate deaminase
MDPVSSERSMKVETSTPDFVMKPIGPYSHIAKAGPFVSISGTAGVDPATGLIAGNDAYTQARQILTSFRLMLENAGSSMHHVTHVHVYLRDMGDFEEMNRAYREAFRDHLPARTVIGVSALPKDGALLTMDLTAVASDGNAGSTG